LIPERDKEIRGIIFPYNSRPLVFHTVWRDVKQRSACRSCLPKVGVHDIFVQYIALNIKFLLTTLKEGGRNTFSSIRRHASLLNLVSCINRFNT
jgi:hypothetical protein